MTVSPWQEEGRRLGWARPWAFNGCTAVTVVVLGMDAVVGPFRNSRDASGRNGGRSEREP